MGAALLRGYRVVEIAHPLTEYAGLVLAGLGADVYLVEPPHGSTTRQRNPRVPGAGDSARGSIAFLARNTNKKSVVIDASNSNDRNLLDRLVERSDVLIKSSDSELASCVADETLPTVVTITDRRRLGTSSIVSFAASGGLASSGWPHQAPCNAPSWLALDGTSIYAATMALMGTLAYRRGGGLMRYEIPFEEAAVAAITPWTRPLHSYGMHAAGQGVVTARVGAAALPIYEALDGYVRALAVTPGQWNAFVEVLGSPEDIVNGPWADPTFRMENADALYMVCSEITRTMRVDDMFRRGQSLGLTITPVYSLNAFREDPHVVGRELFTSIDDPEFGTLELMRSPIRIGESNDTSTVVPAPALGNANLEVLEIAKEPRPEAVPCVDGMDPARPLVGTRVLQLGVGAVVPEAASLLGLFGADVIKVESATRVDFLRQMGLNGYMDVNNCPTFNQLNLGTRSVAVDMTHERGKNLIRDLAGHCDVVMENMRGGVVGRWGLDYEGASAARGDVVYLSSQGLGQGLYDGFQTYGPNLQTFSGVTSQWSHPDDPYPVGTNLNHPDHMAGKQALVPMLAALINRDSNGLGCFIEAAQFETAAYLIGDRFLQQFYEDGEIRPLGNASVDMAPHGCYQVQDEDRWVAFAVEDDAQWARLRNTLDEPWMEDATYATAAGRLAAASELHVRFSEWAKAKRLDEVEESMRTAEVPCSRVVTGDDMAADERAHASGFFPAVSHPSAETRYYTGIPVLLRGQGRPATRRPPMLGEHTEQVLYELLCLTPNEVNTLMAEKTVGC
ncbi:MAG: CoA transferase [Pseudomonadota bacterium]|nr:CoA transferase [Pseudomonadota bacterium]